MVTVLDCVRGLLKSSNPCSYVSLYNEVVTQQTEFTDPKEFDLSIAIDDAANVLIKEGFAVIESSGDSFVLNLA